ncbi:unnamed protein product [Psylliodes chrysocephalus]|uniref:BRISC and BRCA1-A complex member 1 n=1 Tax=Psylliodes chrysocephalus TaxID=3402493 RepID=A0A9P0CMD1_9CUCU|nr:unnamed protein product [Psylliodes chrysocephala]
MNKSKEYIIPIQMEDDIIEQKEDEEIVKINDGSLNETNEDTIECSPNGSPEEFIIEPKKTIKIKPFTEIKDCEEYLRKYDEFEERNKYSLLNINVPEKIILVIDRAQDENCTNFTAGNARYTPMTMLRRCLHLFVKLKNNINKNHEFAIVLLNENDVTWAMPFTSDMRKVNNFIEKITLCEVEDTFDMNLLFEEILPNINVPEEEIAPPYLIRMIIFYGRSYTIPKIEFNKEIKDLLKKPFFICDVLMTHEPADKSNHCNKIFDCLGNMDRKGISYFIPVGRNTLRLHNGMAKLLGHGLQRPIQKFLKI